MIVVKPEWDQLKGRDWITKAYLPSIDGVALYVGVAEYTKRYQSLASRCDEFHTIDHNQARAEFGSTDLHVIEDFLYFEPTVDVGKYDHIAMYGLDPKYTPKEQPNWLVWIEKLARHADEMLRPEGTLLLGGKVELCWKELKRIQPLCNYETIFEREAEIERQLILKWWIRKTQTEN